MALCLSVVLLMCMGPLWVGVVQASADTHALLLDLQRWRVVAARMERDVRMSTAEGRGDLGCVSLLEATSTRVVLVTRSLEGEGLELVAWEFAGEALMRRRSPVTSEGLPLSWSTFPDNKTMLDHVEHGKFVYEGGGRQFESIVGRSDLPLVESVTARCAVSAGEQSPPVSVSARALVGR